MKVGTARAVTPALTGAQATPSYQGVKSSRGTGISATTGTGTRMVSSTSMPTSSTHGMAFPMMPGLRLQLLRPIRLLRRSLYLRIAPRGRRSWPPRGAVASSRRAWHSRRCTGFESTRGVLDHRLGHGLAVGRDDRQPVRSNLIPGAVRRVGDVESARRPHHIGEFDDSAL